MITRLFAWVWALFVKWFSSSKPIEGTSLAPSPPSWHTDRHPLSKAGVEKRKLVGRARQIFKMLDEHPDGTNYVISQRLWKQPPLHIHRVLEVTQDCITFRLHGGRCGGYRARAKVWRHGVYKEFHATTVRYEDIWN